MKTIKLFSIVVCAILFVASIWVSSIFVVPKLTLFLGDTVLCESLSSESVQQENKQLQKKCVNSIAELGATGDLFGAINSLFTGLALFAVAVTLWIDSKARRQSLKPLVISVADKDFFVIDDPKIHPESSLRLHVTPIISNIVNEPALNVSVLVSLEAKKSIHKLSERFYETPLVHGTSLPIEMEELIKGDFLVAFLASLTESSGHIKIVLETKYENLEQVRWLTKVSYVLELHNPSDIAKLNAVRGKDATMQNLWGNSAVALKSAVETGSWKRYLVKD